MKSRNPIRATGSSRQRNWLVLLVAFLIALSLAVGVASSSAREHRAASARAVVSTSVAPRALTRLTEHSLRVKSNWGSVTLGSADVRGGRWHRTAHAATRKTQFGAESIVFGDGRAEEFLTVNRHRGLRVWKWRIGGALRPELAPDGSVRFAKGARVTGPRIDPVEILDGRGHTVTPKRLRWSLTQHGGAYRLALRLDDTK